MDKTPSKGTSKATLARVDKPDEAITFDIPPQKVNRSFQAAYTKLTVLATPQPLLCYQQSESTITLPGLLVIGQKTGQVIKLLESWTKPLEGTLTPPVLKFSFVNLNLPKVVIESAEVVEDMWLGGSDTTRAEVNLTLLLNPDAPAAKVASTKKEEVKLSPDEQAKYLAQIETKVKADPKYQYKPGDVIELKDDSVVLLRGKEIGKLTDFVTLEKKHTAPVGKDKPQLPKPESSASSASKTSK